MHFNIATLLALGVAIPTVVAGPVARRDQSEVVQRDEDASVLVPAPPFGNFPSSEDGPEKRDVVAPESKAKGKGSNGGNKGNKGGNAGNGNNGKGNGGKGNGNNGGKGTATPTKGTATPTKATGGKGNGKGGGKSTATPTKVAGGGGGKGNGGKGNGGAQPTKASGGGKGNGGKGNGGKGGAKTTEASTKPSKTPGKGNGGNGGKGNSGKGNSGKGNSGKGNGGKGNGGKGGSKTTQAPGKPSKGPGKGKQTSTAMPTFTPPTNGTRTTTRRPGGATLVPTPTANALKKNFNIVSVNNGGNELATLEHGENGEGFDLNGEDGVYTYNEASQNVYLGTEVLVVVGDSTVNGAKLPKRVTAAAPSDANVNNRLICSFSQKGSQGQFAACHTTAEPSGVLAKVTVEGSDETYLTLTSTGSLTKKTILYLKAVASDDQDSSDNTGDDSTGDDSAGDDGSDESPEDGEDEDEEEEDEEEED